MIYQSVCTLPTHVSRLQPSWLSLLYLLLVSIFNITTIAEIHALDSFP